jgi:hypothetical protein
MYRDMTLTHLERCRVGRFLTVTTAFVLFVVASGRLAISEEPPKAKSDAAPAAVEKPAPPEKFRIDQKDHWAFQPVVRPDVPQVLEKSAVRNPIDAFVVKSLEDLDFRRAPEATKRELLRRVTFDLTGLPPTPQEAKAFLDDASPDAYEKLVDRLLASPAYGIRWAQHWLDLAHYADSNGFELDADRPDAWRYRDWVIDSLNADMPYDQFLALQIAGDEIRPGDVSALIATGFARSGPREVVSGNIPAEVKRQNDMTSITGTVGSVVLGMTMACARCHDHKFDPIPTTDYYRLQSFWADAELIEEDIASAQEKERIAAENKAIDARIAPLKKRQAELEKPYRERIRKAKEDGLTPKERAVMAKPKEQRTAEEQRLAEGINTALTVHWEEVAEAVAENPADHAEREKIKREVYEIERLRPQPPAKAFAVKGVKPQPDKTYVYRRGEWTNRGPLVEPRPPGVVLAVAGSSGWAQDSAGESAPKPASRRAALANWLTDSANPLVPRVIVNRLWQHHFGRGIVATPSDFGTRGEPPSHPELLDWLASELVAGGWKLKPMHRLMVTSSTYRTRSDFRIAAQEADDPDNTTFYRMNRRRMEAESLRDAILTVSGRLNPQMGGPGVRVPIENELKELIFTEAEVVDLWPVNLDPREFDRRSIYLLRKRNVHYAMYAAFDAPDTQSSCPVRSVSTHAPQALVLLNGAFAQNAARTLAQCTAAEANAGKRAAALFERVLVRPPSDKELARMSEFLGASPNDDAWTDLALTLINSNEFLYIP